MKTQPGDRAILDRPNLVGYLFEPCFEGIRVLIYKDRGNMAIFNKNKKDLITLYPEMLDLPAQIKTKSCILDGILIVFNENKLPDSRLLQERELSSQSKAKAKSRKFPATVIVFDILEKDDESLINEPLKSRKLILREVIENGQHLTLAPYTLHGKDLWKQIESQKLDGMIAKEMNSRYFPNGKNWSWLKINNLNQTDAVIAGLMKKGNLDDFFGIILAKYHKKTDSFKYVGKITENLDKKTISHINSRLKSLSTETAILSKEDIEKLNNAGTNLQDIIWLKPILITKIRYKENVNNEIVLASILRLRNDKNAKDCVFND